MRIIDADELRLGKFVEPRTEWQKGWNDALEAASTQAPTISPDSLVNRARLHIIELNKSEEKVFAACPECGEAFDLTLCAFSPNYYRCPACGALMED